MTKPTKYQRVSALWIVGISNRPYDSGVEEFSVAADTIEQAIAGFPSDSIEFVRYGGPVGVI